MWSQAVDYGRRNKNVRITLTVILFFICALTVVWIVSIIQHEIFMYSYHEMINRFHDDSMNHAPDMTYVNNVPSNWLWVQVAMIVFQYVLYVLLAIIFLRVIDREKFTLAKFSMALTKTNLKWFLTGILIDTVLFVAVIILLVAAGIINFSAFGTSIYGTQAVILSFIMMLIATLSIGIGKKCYSGVISRR